MPLVRFTARRPIGQNDWTERFELDNSLIDVIKCTIIIIGHSGSMLRVCRTADSERGDVCACAILFLRPRKLAGPLGPSRTASVRV